MNNESEDMIFDLTSFYDDDDNKMDNESKMDENQEDKIIVGIDYGMVLHFVQYLML